MFINIKINFKHILILLAIILFILSGFSIYKIFVKNNSEINKDLIKMNTENYTNILKEVHNYPELYVGHKVEVSGFVYKGDYFKDDEFVIARNMIVCCKSDAIIVGFLCKSDMCNKFEENCWVSIKGTMQTVDKDGYKLPYIQVNKISKSIAPTNIDVLPPTI